MGNGPGRPRPCPARSDAPTAAPSGPRGAPWAPCPPARPTGEPGGEAHATPPTEVGVATRPVEVEGPLPRVVLRDAEPAGGGPAWAAGPEGSRYQWLGEIARGGMGAVL